MIRAGITGGIGSGKSVVSRIFEILGVPVFYSDIEAKRLYTVDSGVRSGMVELFGEDIYINNQIDRERMASIIFNNADLLASVNAIIHPAVAAQFIRWCSGHADSPWVIFESAILFESGHSSFMDKVITVTAPEHIRMERILKRPGMTLEIAQAIMQKQADEASLISKSDHVIFNDGINMILPDVLKLYYLLNK